MKFLLSSVAALLLLVTPSLAFSATTGKQVNGLPTPAAPNTTPPKESVQAGGEAPAPKQQAGERNSWWENGESKQHAVADHDWWEKPFGNSASSVGEVVRSGYMSPRTGGGNASTRKSSRPSSPSSNRKKQAAPDASDGGSWWDSPYGKSGMTPTDFPPQW